MGTDEYKKRIEEILTTFENAIDFLNKNNFTEKNLVPLKRGKELLESLAYFNLNISSVPGKLISLEDAKKSRRLFKERFGSVDSDDLPLFLFNKIKINAELLREILIRNDTDSISHYFGFDIKGGEDGGEVVKLLLVPEDSNEKPLLGKNSNQDVLDEMRPCPPPACNDLV